MLRLGMMRCLFLDLTVQASTPLCNYILSITQKSDMIVSNPGSTTALVTTPRWPGRIRRSWDAAWFTTRGPNTMRLLLSATTLKVETSKVHLHFANNLAWLIIIFCFFQGLKCTSLAPPALPAPPATPVTMDSVQRHHKTRTRIYKNMFVKKFKIWSNKALEGSWIQG